MGHPLMRSTVIVVVVGYSTRHPAHLAVPLTRVGVADEEASPGRAHRQVGDGAGTHVGQVHVPAVVVRGQRVDGVNLRRATEGADVRAVGQRHPIAPVHVAFVELDLAHLFPAAAR